ncbi:hypothetical protein [Aureliella helgolandensis]|uniref:hypothetical protein n=1 Tax=Aureliella helgolandensis TaxID=2527968 RepID=UPI0018D0ACD7|nr:hypothetical protein [Aureliella helgolandensis]
MPNELDQLSVRSWQTHLDVCANEDFDGALDRQRLPPMDAGAFEFCMSRLFRIQRDQY